MKRLFFFAVMALVAVVANAQNDPGEGTLKGLVGINIANITPDGGDPLVGLAAGVEAEYGVTDRFGLSAGVFYSMQGSKHKYDISDYRSTTCKVYLDYINVPILANFYVVKGLALKAGIQPGINVRHKAKIGSVEFDLNDLAETSAAYDTEGVDEGAMGKINTFDFSIPIGLSYEYEGFMVDLRYNIGLTKVQKGERSRNSVFMLTVGYNIDFDD